MNEDNAEKLARYQEIVNRGLVDRLSEDKQIKVGILIDRGLLKAAEPVEAPGQAAMPEQAAPVQQEAPAPTIPEQSTPAAPAAPAPHKTLMQAAQDVVAPLPHNNVLSSEYWTQNVPQSLSRLPVMATAGAAGMVYDAAKEFTDPFVNLLDSPMKGKDWLKAGKDLAYAPNRAVMGAVEGVKDFVNAPLGMSDKTSASEAWDDPAASLMAISPLLKAGGKALPKGNLGEHLTRKSLQFSPTVRTAVQKKVAGTIRKARVNVTEKGLAEFGETLKAKNEQVRAALEPVADAPIDLNLRDIVKKRIIALENTSKKGKNVKKTQQFLQQFYDDHIAKFSKDGEQIGEKTLTVQQAQLIKQDINKELTNYWRAKAMGGKLQTAQHEAMRSIGDSLRAEIERHAPETKQMNTEISDMITAQPFLEKAVSKAGKSAVPGYKDLVSGAVAGQMFGAEFGLPTIVASKVLRDPRVVGGAGKALYTIGEFGRRIKGMLKGPELELLVADIDKQAQAQLPAGQNQLALPPGKGPAIPMGEAPTKPILLGGTPAPKQNLLALPPAEHLRGVAEMTPLERMYQIAQSAEGKRLLLERLGKEARHSKLVAELFKVPTTSQKMLPVGQGFEMVTPIGAEGRPSMNALERRQEFAKKRFGDQRPYPFRSPEEVAKDAELAAAKVAEKATKIAKAKAAKKANKPVKKETL